MELCVMIEGQEDVSWDDWLAIAASCEENGIPALFRSDHYLSVFGEDGRGSLDAWGTLCGLAAATTTLRLGTMVSPTSFRHPSVLAKMIATADQISGGRIEPGIGAGWHQPEHEAFGFPYLSLKERMEVFEEQLEIVTGRWSAGEFEFHGKYYDMTPVDAQPKPVQDPMPLILGGKAKPKGAALAARFATEYNMSNPTGIDDVVEGRARIETAWKEAGRDPETVRLSVMTGAAIGRDEAEAGERLRRARERAGRPEMEYRFHGSPDQLIEQFRTWNEAGVERAMVQLLLHDDLEQIEILGREVAPALR